jgi:hypothetical protein
LGVCGQVVELGVVGPEMGNICAEFFVCGEAGIVRCGARSDRGFELGETVRIMFVESFLFGR